MVFRLLVRLHFLLNSDSIEKCRELFEKRLCIFYISVIVILYMGFENALTAA